MAVKIPIPTEAQEQAWLASYLDYLGVLWCHVPNASRNPVHYRAKLARQGLKSGVPDILVFTPPPAIPNARGCAIELKRQKGGRPSDTQKWWLSQMAEIGWQARIALGCEDASQWLVNEMGYRVKK